MDKKTMEEVIEGNFDVTDNYGEAIEGLIKALKDAGYVHKDSIALKLPELYDMLINYCVHDGMCIWSQLRQGKPTDDGDYLSLYGYGNKAKWYSRNKKEEPECSCGLNKIIDKVKEMN